jgi:predicted phosphate transport protein (TIGR00153 family)
MLSWFQALMPREERFFELFVRHAELVIAGAQALRRLLDGGDSVPRYCKEIMDRENNADEITRQVLTAVRRTFITPLDRGDIQDLITSMDDAIDQMNKTAKAVLLYEVRQFDQPMREMGEAILRAAKLMFEALPLLQSIGKNAARLNEITEAIIQVEEQADQLYEQGRKELFLAHRNSGGMAFFIGTELYDHLEKVVDRFEDVANEISAIVIEHA